MTASSSIGSMLLHWHLALCVVLWTLPYLLGQNPSYITLQASQQFGIDGGIHAFSWLVLFACLRTKQHWFWVLGRRRRERMGRRTRGLGKSIQMAPGMISDMVEKHALSKDMKHQNANKH